MYDHPVSRDYNKNVMCDGCQHCPDVDYLSEDSDDGYFLRYSDDIYFLDDPYMVRSEIDEFENSYNLSPLFEPDLHPDFYRNYDLSFADDW